MNPSVMEISLESDVDGDDDDVVVVEEEEEEDVVVDIHKGCATPERHEEHTPNTGTCGRP